jgi:hypothetical protein
MRRATIAMSVVILVIAGIAYGAVSLWHSYDNHINAGCTFGAFSTDTSQANIAASMVSVVVTRQLPERAAVLVLAAGLQESKLRNIAAGSGDRDSVGVLQQRPSQGWGTEAQLSDVTFATGAFLDRLVKTAGWETLPLARAIQNVQISADEDAYAKHEDRAQAIADGLTGATPRGISCRFGAPSKTATSASVASSLTAALPVNPPTVDGRQITVPGASSATAAWFVANADHYGIDSVTYDGARWKRTEGWRDDKSAGTGAVIATMHG